MLLSLVLRDNIKIDLLTSRPDHPVPHEVRLVGHEDAGSAPQLRPDVAKDPVRRKIRL